MNTENKTLSQTLAENLSYYVNDINKRCTEINTQRCRYSGKSLGIDTEGCFIGRFLSEEDRLNADNHSIGGVRDLVSSCDSFNISVPNVIKNNLESFSCFQTLHDMNSYWNEKGLSVEGKSFLKYIIKEHKLEEKEFEKFLK